MKRLTAKQIMDHLDFKLGSLRSIQKNWNSRIKNFPERCPDDFYNDLVILDTQETFLAELIDELKSLNHETQKNDTEA